MPPPIRYGLDESKMFFFAKSTPEDPGPPIILWGDINMASL